MLVPIRKNIVIENHKHIVNTITLFDDSEYIFVEAGLREYTNGVVQGLIENWDTKDLINLPSAYNGICKEERWTAIVRIEGTKYEMVSTSLKVEMVDIASCDMPISNSKIEILDGIPVIKGKYRDFTTEIKREKDIEDGRKAMRKSQVMKQALPYDIKDVNGAIVILSNKTTDDFEYLKLPNGASVLQGFSKLKTVNKIELPNSLGRILHDSLCYLENVEEIVIPNSVALIGEDVLCNCRKLKRVRLSSKLVGTGNRFMAGCRGVTVEVYRETPLLMNAKEHLKLIRGVGRNNKVTFI